MLQTSASLLPEKLRSGLKKYSDHVHVLLGPKLLSLTIFGAVLTSDWPTKHGTIHHVIVMTDEDLDLIAALGGLKATAAKAGMSVPIVVPASQVQSSLDTFPLEWMEISQCHEVLLGSDLFASLAFSREHVRLQCERELLVLVISLRQRLVSLSGGIAPEFPLHDLAEQAIRALRGLIYLRNETPRLAPSEVIAHAQQALGHDLQPIARALRGETGLALIKELHRTLTHLQDVSNRA